MCARPAVISRRLNRIDAQFTALRYFTLDGPTTPDTRERGPGPCEAAQPAPWYRFRPARQISRAASAVATLPRRNSPTPPASSNPSLLSKLWFLGAEAGFTTDQVKATYTDGTTSAGTLCFPNWCCTEGTEDGATTVVTTDHRNTPTGPANFGSGCKLFGNSVPLTAGKTIRTGHPARRGTDPRLRDHRAVARRTGPLR
ncbi:hypothetical protein ACFU7T_09975 [Streptomyces sp. NPDC057555]|uniref:hypothetical protein n=1 Tax=Streptomyces sp. NPDC057555 TaxID=3346166 RepID=UPI0036A23586